MIIIEFILSLVFVCLLISLFVSWIIDWWASRNNKKGDLLKQMLGKLLDKEKDNEWVKKLYDHPIIKSLSFDEKRKTSNIPPKLFAEALSDIIIQEGLKNNDTKGALDFEKGLKEGFNKLPEGDFKNSIQTFLNITKGEVKSFLGEIENWYSEYMQRVNHAYRRKLKFPLFIIGAAIALIFNIDAIRITSELWNDSHLRGNIAAMAVQYSDTTKTSNPDSLNEHFFEDIKAELQLPIGWDHFETDFCHYKIKTLKTINVITKEKTSSRVSSGITWIIFIILKLIGFLLTGLIASFGAPFWYDALQKIVGLKKTIKT